MLLEMFLFSLFCYLQDGCESIAQVKSIQGKGGVESEEAAKCREVEKGKEGGEKEATCKKVCKTKRLKRIILKERNICFFAPE